MASISTPASLSRGEEGKLELIHQHVSSRDRPPTPERQVPPQGHHPEAPVQVPQRGLLQGSDWRKRGANSPGAGGVLEAPVGHMTSLTEQPIKGNPKPPKMSSRLAYLNVTILASSHKH